jgi:predicted RNA-binding protein with PIN domain
VATSDFTEQSVTFGAGALRLSARELWIKIQENVREVSKQVDAQPLSQRNTFDNRMNSELRSLFDRWRKGL